MSTLQGSFSTVTGHPIPPGTFVRLEDKSKKKIEVGNKWYRVKSSRIEAGEWIYELVACETPSAKADEYSTEDYNIKRH